MSEDVAFGKADHGKRDDILAMVSGNFTPKSLGAELYAEILGRARANAKAFLAECEAMFLGLNFDAVAQADLLIPTLLKFLRDVEPEGVRATAGRFLKQYNAILTFHDAVADRAAFRQLLPEDTMRLSQRLDSRRRELEELVK